MPSVYFGKLGFMARVLLEQHKHPAFPRLTLQLRSNSRFYQAVTFLDGKKHLKSMKTEKLPTAFKLGETWYRNLVRASIQDAKRHPIDRLATDPTIGELFASYRTTLTASKREYADMKWTTEVDHHRAVLANDSRHRRDAANIQGVLQLAAATAVHSERAEMRAEESQHP